jgi:hypothetical protein
MIDEVADSEERLRTIANPLGGPIDSLELCGEPAGVGRIDLMRKSDETFDVAFHTDSRGEASPDTVSHCADLWVGERIKVGFDVIPERASKVRRASIH